jgi:hypothetical protein
MRIPTRFRGPDKRHSVVGLVVVLFGLLKCHAIIGLMVAAYVFVDPHQFEVCAEPVGETSGSLFPADQFSGDAAASSESLLELGNATGVDHVLTDFDVVPMAFNQPGADPRLATPSYLEPKSPDKEGLPEPSYLDEVTEELPLSEQLEQFNQRLRELEAAKIANEDATRTIIRRSFAERGSNITDAVVFGGTLEALTFWANDFDGTSQSDIVLDTAELDFEILVNPWVLGSLVFEYDDGTNLAFPTTEGDEAFVDRVNVRQAFITVGNTANYPLFATTGRDVVPFGISTGDPVADVLTIIDPLTVEVFEMREDFLMFGFVGPTCCPPPASTTPIPAPAKPRPMLFNPAARRAATTFCSYCPCTPPAKPLPEYLPPPTCIPPYSGAVYIFNGDTFDAGNDHIEHIGGTLGYRTRNTLPNGIPWTVDLDVDVTSSVFDSNFLQFEYFPFLNQIGYVPAMAGHAKYSVGPYAFVLEWNGALTTADFNDDAGTPISIQPEAWQIQVAYQFDWNPYVEVIGAQGTYVVFGYSESRDLAGVMKDIGDPMTPVLIRVGNVPERRFSAGIGEWVMDGLRIALEYSHVIDYGVDPTTRATGNSADGVFMQVTYEW